MRALRGLPERAGVASDHDPAVRRLRTARQEEAQDGWKRGERKDMAACGPNEAAAARTGRRGKRHGPQSRRLAVLPEGRRGR